MIVTLVVPRTGRAEAKTPPRALPAQLVGAAPQGDLTPEQAAALDKQRAAFNFLAAEGAEVMREGNLLRDMMSEQRKHDDEYLKKLIALI